MAGRYVRQSSYRHVFGTPAKEAFAGIKFTSGGEGNNISGNTKFFALPVYGGGGPVLIHPLNKPGRFGAKVPILSVHKYAVWDVQFHPFIDNMVATGDDGAQIKISKFPEEGLKEDVTECLATMEGHSKKINFLAFNPVANNILASVSADESVRIWDIEAQAEARALDLTGEAKGSIFSFEWNRNGSQAVLHCKDGKLRIYDPREAKVARSGESFKGNKKSTITWAENHNLLVGLGFSSGAARQYAAWDLRGDLAKAVAMTEIDQASGTFVTYYDYDNSILWGAGKGDGSVKYWEVVSESPYVHYLSQFSDNNSQQGGCFLPKRYCDVTKCEIANFLRIVKDKESVIPVSFQVPRKSDLFQKDLYPDALAGVPSLEAKEWLDGKNADPKLQSMKPGAAAPEKPAAVAAFVAKRSPAEMEAEIERLTARVKELEAQLAAK
jgi:coronin-1B/1C/6